jgi:hypothetical protein
MPTCCPTPVQGYRCIFKIEKFCREPCAPNPGQRCDGGHDHRKHQHFVFSQGNPPVSVLPQVSSCAASALASTHPLRFRRGINEFRVRSRSGSPGPIIASVALNSEGLTLTPTGTVEPRRHNRGPCPDRRVALHVIVFPSPRPYGRTESVGHEREQC